MDFSVCKALSTFPFPSVDAVRDEVSPVLVACVSCHVCPHLCHPGPLWMLAWAVGVGGSKALRAGVGECVCGPLEVPCGVLSIPLISIPPLLGLMPAIFLREFWNPLGCLILISCPNSTA